MQTSKMNCTWQCPEEKFRNVKECPNSAVVIPDLPGSLAKEQAKSLTYVFVLKVVTSIDTGLGTE